MTRQIQLTQREQMIADTAHAETRQAVCPGCGREVAVTLDGLILQHTDPATWKGKPRQCEAEFTNLRAYRRGPPQ